MKKIYETADGSRSISLYMPLLRSLLNFRPGYAIKITDISGTRTYPQFPWHFPSMTEMREHLRAAGEETLASDLVSHVKSLIRKENKSRLYKGHATSLFDEELRSFEQLLDEAVRTGTEQLERTGILELEKGKLLEKISGYEDLIGLMENEAAGSKSRITALTEERNSLRRLGYLSDKLAGCSADELAAYEAVLPCLMPPASGIKPSDKYHPNEHHRPNCFDDFARKLSEIEFVTSVHYRAARGSHREPVRVEGGNIKVFFYHDDPPVGHSPDNGKKCRAAGHRGGLHQACHVQPQEGLKSHLQQCLKLLQC